MKADFEAGQKYGHMLAENQALGHWDLFARSPAETTAGSGDPITVIGEGGTINDLSYCEALRLDLITGCISLLPALFAFHGCTAAAATAWHNCFQDTGMQLVDVIPGEVCGDECLKMLSNVDAPEADANGFTKKSDNEMKADFEAGQKYSKMLAEKFTLFRI
jgi:hypothetical protein